MAPARQEEHAVEQIVGDEKLQGNGQQYGDDGQVYEPFPEADLAYLQQLEACHAHKDRDEYRGNAEAVVYQSEREPRAQITGPVADGPRAPLRRVHEALVQTSVYEERDDGHGNIYGHQQDNETNDEPQVFLFQELPALLLYCCGDCGVAFFRCFPFGHLLSLFLCCKDTKNYYFMSFNKMEVAGGHHQKNDYICPDINIKY